MRKLFLIIIFAITITALNAQSNDDLITVKRGDLPSDLVERLDQQKKLQNLKQNLDSIKTITGVGKEIGIAINDGLSAITDQTAKFAKTTPGKFTMFLIAWKVMAKDAQEITRSILGILFGVPFLIFVEFFMLWIYRRTTSKRKTLVSETDGKKTYEESDTWFTKTNDDYDNEANRTAFIICWWIVILAANIWIIAGIIF